MRAPTNRERRHPDDKAVLILAAFFAKRSQAVVAWQRRQDHARWETAKLS
jgi:hypothetical protein